MRHLYVGCRTTNFSGPLICPGCGWAGVSLNVTKILLFDFQGSRGHSYILVYIKSLLNPFLCAKILGSNICFFDKSTFKILSIFLDLFPTLVWFIPYFGASFFGLEALDFRFFVFIKDTMSENIMYSRFLVCNITTLQLNYNFYQANILLKVEY